MNVGRWKCDSESQGEYSGDMGTFGADKTDIRD